MLGQFCGVGVCVAHATPHSVCAGVGVGGGGGGGGGGSLARLKLIDGIKGLKPLPRLGDLYPGFSHSICCTVTLLNCGQYIVPIRRSSPSFSPFYFSQQSFLLLI